MPLKSLKYNYILNLVNTLAGLLFPLLTFPYVARILEPDGLGLVSFYQSIITYITLLSSLGIGMYATREIARVKDNAPIRDKVSVEILLLHLSLTLIGYIAVVVLCLTVKRISAHEGLFLILSIPIFFNALGVYWFFQAMEDFLFVTLRSLAFKFIAAIALFLFVKTPDDILPYAIILVGADIGNNILNLLRLRRYISSDHIKPSSLQILRHLRPAFTIFTLNVITSIYVGLSPLLLGFLDSDDSVGYFTATSRLTTAALSIVTALGTTMVPRMSYYISHNDTVRFNSTAIKCLDFIFALSMPLSIGMAITSQELILVFSGYEFTPAIPTMCIMAPTVLIISIAAIIGYQVLYPLGHEKLIIRSSLLAAIVFFPLSFILISTLSQNGAATSYLIAETVCTSALIYYCSKYLKYNYFNFSNIKTLASCGLMCASVITFRHFVSLAPLPLLAVETAIGIFAYIVMMNALKHPLFIELTSIIKSKLSGQNAQEA